MSLRPWSDLTIPERSARVARAAFHKGNQYLQMRDELGPVFRDEEFAVLRDMDTTSTLVQIYLFICRRYRERLAAVAQRQSNNADPAFTDEEVLTVYVFGPIKKRSTISEIHKYVEDHFSEWFPDLPSYQSYNRRLNRLSAVFAPLVEEAISEISCKGTVGEALRIADSMPIMMAKGQRASQAEVASDRLASVGYCSSKDTFFHGVKLHLVVERRRKKLPVPERAGLTSGSENDLRALRRVLPTIEEGVLCGDKAYCDGPLKERLAEDQNLDLLTPVKKNKGQKTLSAAGKLFSEAVSRIRQPIESLFSWINEKTGIQQASKVEQTRYDGRSFTFQICDTDYAQNASAVPTEVQRKDRRTCPERANP